MLIALKNYRIRSETQLGGLHKKERHAPVEQCSVSAARRRKRKERLDGGRVLRKERQRTNQLAVVQVDQRWALPNDVQVGAVGAPIANFARICVDNQWICDKKKSISESMANYIFLGGHGQRRI